MIIYGCFFNKFVTKNFVRLQNKWKKNQKQLISFLVIPMAMLNKFKAKTPEEGKKMKKTSYF